MSFEAAFLDFMPHTITVYEHDSFNAYGEPSYSTAGTTYSAMIEERPDVIRAAFGDEVVSSHIVYVASTSRIPMTARVVLNDGSTSPPEPPLVRSDVFSDQDGIHHVALFFGSGAGGG